jgi:hypothetical protein
MHHFGPNSHLVSTSFWHSFPKAAFWANSAYPDVDFADVHRYIEESDPVFNDTALSTYNISMQYGARQSGGAGKPVIRGETGFVVSGSEPPTSLFDQDTTALWLHNFIWGAINSGGLIESYWYETDHIYRRNPNGQIVFDHRPVYRTFYNFIQDIPLNNGNYQDAQAVVTNDQLRAWGQKDLVNGRAHLWIQNKGNTWRNLVNGVPPAAASGIVQLHGFQPGMQYRLQWWDPYQPDPSRQILRTEVVVASNDGQVTIAVNRLTADVAVQLLRDQPMIFTPQAFLPLVILSAQ